MPSELAARCVLLMLFGLLLVLSHLEPSKAGRGMFFRKFSLASPLSVATGLACIALLYIAHDVEPPRTEWVISALVIIPICVVLTSVFAVSFWEPVVISLVLFLIPRLLHFMPTGREFTPLVYLAIILIFSLIYSAVGCLVIYLARRLRQGQWSWSFTRGLGWGVPCSLGSMIAFKSKMVNDIAFRGDYTIIYLILGEFVLLTGLTGIKRSRQAAPPTSPSQSNEPLVTAGAESGVTAQQDSEIWDSRDWRSIRDYSQLFRGGRGINYPVGAAFALASFLTNLLNGVLSKAFQHDWASLWHELPRLLTRGLMVALVQGTLFLLVSRFVRRTWALPLVWGVVAETQAAVYVLILSKSITASMGLSLYGIVGAGLFMAGLVVAVHTWGPRLGSLIAGLIGSYVPMGIYGLLLSVPGRNILITLVYKVIFATFLYFGLRFYFEGSVRRSPAR
jgi:hypothetical protein